MARAAQVKTMTPETADPEQEIWYGTNGWQREGTFRPNRSSYPHTEAIRTTSYFPDVRRHFFVYRTAVVHLGEERRV